MTTTTFKQCCDRLKSFLGARNESTIRFRYFGRCMKTPLISENLAEWEVDGNMCYIVKGASAPWSYTYSPTSLQKLVLNPATDTSVTAYEPAEQHGDEITGGNDDHVEQGDHITIGVVKYGGQLWMKTHKTLYRELEMPAGTWDRTTIECNFILEDSVVTDAAKCYMSTEPFGVKYASDPLAKAVIKEMNKIYCAIPQSGGVPRKEYTTYRGSRYLLRCGKRGGQYIQLRGGKKLYNVGKSIQTGGQEPAISHKGIGFSDNLVAFIHEHVISKVEAIRPDFDSATLLYDEFSQLGDGANKQIVIVYDLRDLTYVFYLDAEKAMIAYYVTNLPPSSEVTPYERTCHQEFMVHITQSLQVLQPVA